MESKCRLALYSKLILTTCDSFFFFFHFDHLLKLAKAEEKEHVAQCLHESQEPAARTDSALDLKQIGNYLSSQDSSFDFMAFQQGQYKHLLLGHMGDTIQSMNPLNSHSHNIIDNNSKRLYGVYTAPGTLQQFCIITSFNPYNDSMIQEQTWAIWACFLSADDVRASDTGRETVT